MSMHRVHVHVTYAWGHTCTYLLKKAVLLRGALYISSRIPTPGSICVYDALSEIWTPQVEGTSGRWPFIHRV